MNPGDKVRIISTEPIGWENDCYLMYAYEDAGIDYPDGIAEIEVIEIDKGGTFVQIAGSDFYLHPDHFAVVINYIKQIMKLTNEQVINLDWGLDECLSMRGDRFSEIVLKNSRKIKPFAQKIGEKLMKLRKNTKAYEKWLKERDELAKEHAVKNENGDPVFNRGAKGQTVTIENPKAYQKAGKELEKKHAEAIEGKKKQQEAEEKFLKETSAIELIMIDKDIMSVDMTAETRELIEPIIN